MKFSGIRIGIHVLAVAASFLLPVAARAQDVVMTSNPDKWQFSVLLYGWLPTIKSTMSFPLADTGGTATLNPNDILNNLNLAGMASFGVMYNRFGFFTDAMYMNLGHTKSGFKDFQLPNQEPGDLSASVNLSIKATIVTAAFQYKVIEQPDFAMNVLAGGRYFSLKPSLSWYFSANLVNNPGISRGGERSLSSDDFDGIVGLKGQWMLGSSHTWALPFYADIGGGDSKMTYQLAGGIAYHLGSWEFGALYRKLYYHLDDTRLTHMVIDGPMIGGLYRW